MKRSKHVITSKQVEDLAAVLDARFVSAKGMPVKPQCNTTRCRNKVTQLAVCGVISIRTCSDSYCRMYAAITAHYLNLPASATPRIHRAFKKIRAVVSQPNAN